MRLSFQKANASRTNRESSLRDDGLQYIRVEKVYRNRKIIRAGYDNNHHIISWNSEYPLTLRARRCQYIVGRFAALASPVNQKAVYALYTIVANALDQLLYSHTIKPLIFRSQSPPLA